MKKSIRKRTRRKPGPPRTTGKGTLVGVRCQAPFLVRLDAWREAEGVGRPAAIRALAELGLASARSAKPRSKKAASKASELAAREIDVLADESATDIERASRKRRLLKGPKEFRDIRSDHPKAKT